MTSLELEFLFKKIKKLKKIREDKDKCVFVSDNISCFIFSKETDNATIVFISFIFFISFNFPKGIDNATINYLYLWNKS